MEQLARSDLDLAFEALADVRRRRLLIALLEHDTQSDTVLVPEDVHVGEKDLETIQMEIHHKHLPTLEEVGFIKWNRRDHEVSKGPKFDEIGPLLELIHEHQDELPEGIV